VKRSPLYQKKKMGHSLKEEERGKKNIWMMGEVKN
jgi:hypothetical protein